MRQQQITANRVSISSWKNSSAARDWEGYAASVLEDFCNRAVDEFGRLWTVAWRYCAREPGEVERGCICGTAKGDHERESSEGYGREPGAGRGTVGTEREQSGP